MQNAFYLQTVWAFHLLPCGNWYLCFGPKENGEREETRNDHSVVMIWGDLMKALVLNSIVLSSILLLSGFMLHRNLTYL